MPYLLDTNICIYFANGRHAKVTQRIESIPIDQLNVSVITYAELLYGAAKSDRPGVNQVVIEKLMANHLQPRPLPRRCYRIRPSKSSLARHGSDHQ